MKIKAPQSKIISAKGISHKASQASALSLLRKLEGYQNIYLCYNPNREFIKIIIKV